MSDEEEEDWFERALRDLEGNPTDTEETDELGPEGQENDGGSTDGDDGSTDRDDGSTGEDGGSDGSLPTDDAGDTVDPDDRAVPDPEDDPFGGVRRPSAAAVDDTDTTDGADDLGESTGMVDAPKSTPDDTADGHEGGGKDDPIDDDSDDPFGGGSDGPVAEGSDDPFDGEGDAVNGEDGDPFGGKGGDSFGGGSDGTFGGGSDGPFDGGSHDTFGGSGEGDGFGFSDFDGPSADAGSPFGGAEAEFDSDIDRIDIGIEGLDEMILGGVPSRSLMSVIGSAGTGKTTFALQFLNEGLEAGEKVVYLTLEQSREAMHDTAEEKGWPFREYSANDQLAIVAMDPIEMANSLTSIRNDFSRLIADFGAERLVLDSVSLLEMMYDRPAQRRSEVFDFTRSLKESGVTTLLTSEASEENPYASRYGIVEYLTDAVFVLQYVRGTDFRETRLAVEIQKIRDANHSRETKPYEISNGGISVYRQANIF